MRILFIFFIACSLILSSCASYKAFTQDMIEDYNLDEQGIKKLQFYISDPIRFEREVKEINKNIEPSHSLLTVEDKLIDRIDFEEKIPCLVLAVRYKSLYVAFEKNDYLLFKLSDNNRFKYEPDVEKIYELPESIRYDSNYKIIGMENYDQLTYFAKIKGRVPYLLIDEKSLRNLEIKARKVKGMKQPDL